jgi:capsular polysaccharide transport system ATP-binding protein
MIHLRNVMKTYETRSGPRTVLDHINLEVAPGEKLGILGRNGAGKSTLIRLISGAEQPTSGLVERDMSISWPLAFAGGFHGALSGLDNIRFICRVYGAPIKPAIDFVESFAELGQYLREPVKTYSSGMRARLAFAISMGVEFDCFLIDEIVAVGDDRFHAKCHAELFEKRRDRAMIIVSHNAAFIREHCTRATVLMGGKLHNFDSVDEALAFHDAGQSA